MNPRLLICTLLCGLLAGCQSQNAGNGPGLSKPVGPLAKSLPIGAKVNRRVAFATAKVIAPGAPDFPSGPAVSAYFGESLIGCTVSHQEMTVLAKLKEGTPVTMTGVVGQHNFLGVWLKPGCKVHRDWSSFTN